MRSSEIFPEIKRKTPPSVPISAGRGARQAEIATRGSFIGPAAVAKRLGVARGSVYRGTGGGLDVQRAGSINAAAHATARTNAVIIQMLMRPFSDARRGPCAGTGQYQHQADEDRRLKRRQSPGSTHVDNSVTRPE
jgi:hypothetical protein